MRACVTQGFPSQAGSNDVSLQHGMNHIVAQGDTLTVVEKVKLHSGSPGADFSISRLRQFDPSSTWHGARPSLKQHAHTHE
jgi:hypothetical protein